MLVMLSWYTVVFSVLLNFVKPTGSSVWVFVCNQWFSTLSILPLERGWIKHSTTNKTERNCFAFCTNIHSHTLTHTQQYFWYSVVDVTCAKNVQCIVKYFTELNLLCRTMSESRKMWAFFLFVRGPKILWQHEFVLLHSLCFRIDVRNQNCSITKINSIKHATNSNQQCLTQNCWDFCHANNFSHNMSRAQYKFVSPHESVAESNAITFVSAFPYDLNRIIHIKLCAVK